MALIECPECGKVVSDRAWACPQCGYPIAGSPVYSTQNQTVAVQFPNTFKIRYTCKIYDEYGNVLATCKQGEVASFFAQNP